MRKSQVNCIHSGRAGGGILGIVSGCRKVGAGQGHGMGQLWAVTGVNPWESENEELMAAAVMEPWHESMIAGRGATG